jgi:hypothetical protein
MSPLTFQGEIGLFRLRLFRPLRPLRPFRFFRFFPPFFTALTTLDVAVMALRDTLAMTLDVVAVYTEEFA